MDQAHLIARHIEGNPRRRGLAEAEIADHGVPVWAIVAYLKGVGGDIDRTAEDYRLPREAIEAALAYYECHKDVIDARLEANLAPVA